MLKYVMPNPKYYTIERICHGGKLQGTQHNYNLNLTLRNPAQGIFRILLTMVSLKTVNYTCSEQ